MSIDGETLKHLFQHSKPGIPHTVEHYLYFPSMASAQAAEMKLRTKGLEVDLQPSADESGWVIFARHKIVPTEVSIAAARSLMEAVAKDGDGEYDGWEAAVER